MLGTHALQAPTARWGQRCQVRTEGRCGVCGNFGPHPGDTPVPHIQYCVCKFTGTAENCPPHRQGHHSAWWLPSLSEGAQGQTPQDEHRAAWCPRHPLREAAGQPRGLAWKWALPRRQARSRPHHHPGDAAAPPSLPEAAPTHGLSLGPGSGQPGSRHDQCPLGSCTLAPPQSCGQSRR